MKVRILFVCLGNICRSPAADGVLHKLAEEAGVGQRLEIDSCGMGGWHVGQLPDPRMRRCGAQHGYRFDHRARQIEAADFGRFDRILAMDADNYRGLMRMARRPEQQQKIGMLADYMSEHPGRSVIPDPYYGDASDFELALELIEDACRGLLRELIS